jgi:hypothetical protein
VKYWLHADFTMLVYNCINGGGSVLILATILSTIFAGEGQFIIVVLFSPLKPTHNVQIFGKYFDNFCFWDGISNLFKAYFDSLYFPLFHFCPSWNALFLHIFQYAISSIIEHL